MRYWVYENKKKKISEKRLVRARASGNFDTLKTRGEQVGKWSSYYVLYDMYIYGHNRASAVEHGGSRAKHIREETHAN